MKTLIIYLTVVLWAGVINAQEVIQLNEARVSYHPLNAEVTKNGNSFSYNVKQAHAGEFEQNPLLFMKENFDIQNFISHVADKNYDLYVVRFMSKKGYLIADLDKNGKILRSSQRFEDVILPEALRKQLAKEYQGWSVNKSLHIARGNGGEKHVDFYKIKIANGKEKKSLKINAASVNNSTVAFN